MSPLVIPSPAQRSPFAFDWLPEACREARDFTLDAVTGQPATFARPSTSTSIDSEGRSIAIGYGRPRFEWGALDFGDGVETVGIRLNGDALSFPFLVGPHLLTVYVRMMRHTAAGSNAVVVSIGGSTGARLVITEQSGGVYRATYNDGSTSSTSTVTRPSFDGDGVELRVVLSASGLTLSQAIVGSDEEFAATSAPLTLASAWASSTLYLGSNAAIANPSHNTYVRVAVARGDVPMAAFRPAFRTIVAVPTTVLYIVEVSPNVFEFTDVGPADLELADITATGVYETIPAGTSLSAPRINARQVGLNTLVY